VPENITDILNIVHKHEFNIIVNATSFNEQLVFKHVFDYVFLFGLESRNCLNKIWKNYYDFLNSYDIFTTIFDETTKNNGTLVADIKNNEIYHHVVQYWGDDN